MNLHFRKRKRKPSVYTVAVVVAKATADEEAAAEEVAAAEVQRGESCNREESYSRGKNCSNAAAEEVTATMLQQRRKLRLWTTRA